MESVERAASGSRFKIESTDSRKDVYGWHDGGLDFSSSWSIFPGTMSLDKTVEGATLDRTTKQRSAGRETGGNVHKDQAKRASVNATMHERPERDSVVLKSKSKRTQVINRVFGGWGKYSEDNNSAPCMSASDSPKAPLSLRACNNCLNGEMGPLRRHI
jgi:hypothetical protein